MQKPMYFEPDGNDLAKVLHYYGLDLDNKICCPFHDDNRPSCHIDYEKGLFRCFACDATGDAFQFVKLANPKLNDLQQLRLYFAILNSDRVKKGFRNKQLRTVRKQKQVDKQLELEIASDYYYGLKSVDWFTVESEYKDYMLERGFTEQTLNDAQAKLTITDNIYPLIFPILDLGEFKGYVCRTTNKRVEKERKYLYNKGFSRNNTICGDYNSKVVTICEGYMDRLKLKQFGLKNVAAIFGWKITSKQVEKLRKQGVKTIISALDMDEPGRKGNDYLKNFFDVVEFQFPKGVKDPGDLTEEQFKVAYRKTRKLFKARRNVDVNSK